MPAGPAPTTATRLAGLAARRLRHDPALLPGTVDDRVLDLFDRHRVALADLEHARRLARSGAQAAGELGEVVGRVQLDDRVARSGRGRRGRSSRGSGCRAGSRCGRTARRSPCSARPARAARRPGARAGTRGSRARARPDPVAGLRGARFAGSRRACPSSARLADRVERPAQPTGLRFRAARAERAPLPRPARAGRACSRAASPSRTRRAREQASHSASTRAATGESVRRPCSSIIARSSIASASESCFEADHAHVAALGELAVLVEHVGDAAAHARREVASGRAEHDDAPAGHVLAAVVADALDDRPGAGVANREALAGEAAEEGPPAVAPYSTVLPTITFCSALKCSPMPSRGRIAKTPPERPLPA